LRLEKIVNSFSNRFCPEKLEENDLFCTLEKDTFLYLFSQEQSS